jgi:DNA polymerase I
MGELARQVLARRRHKRLGILMSQVGRNGQESPASTAGLQADVVKEPATDTAVLDPDTVAEREAIQHEDDLPAPETVRDLFPDDVSKPAIITEGDDLPQSSMSPTPPETETAIPEAVAGSSIEVGASFELPSVIYIKETSQIEQVLPQLLSAQTVGLDTETTGLDPLADKLRTVQLATSEHVVVIDAFHCPVEMLAPLMEGTRWLIGHNLKFDLKFQIQTGLPWPSTPCFDTMLGAQILAASTKPAVEDAYSLAGLAEHFLNTPLDKSLQQSEWDLELSPQQIRYAAMDAAILLPLAKKEGASLREVKLWRVAELESTCMRTLAWIELAGMPIDAEQWREHAGAHAQRKQELAEELSTLAGQSLNWNSNPQILAVLQARGLPVTSTNREALLPFIMDDLVAHLFEYRRVANRAQTYGVKWLRYLHPNTGRVHADFWQLGSSAGRMSCKKPNLQNIPREQVYRGLFRVSQDRCLVKADYSQIELRLAAIIAPDETLLQAYLAGEDLHIRTAAGLVEVQPDQVTKEQRQLAKAVNFGLLYAMGAPRLQEYAWEEYGVRLSEAEAYQHRARWFELHPGIRKWHDRVGGKINGRRAIETRTLYGRRRLGVNYLPDALNSPVQGSGADGLKGALVRLFQHRDEVPHARVVNVVHDEVLAECPIDEAEATATWLKTHMETAMQDVVQGKVPTPVEVYIGRSWAE